jgi:histidinol-phosphate/aromatic aminotransferase/cobyric acid decarboxylase-like protein
VKDTHGIIIPSNSVKNEIKRYDSYTRLVRDCSTFSRMGSNYIRVGIKNHVENLILDALESFEN